jgi:hypothetical protein
MAIQEDWQQLTATEKEHLNEATKQLHFAAQFPATFGHNLLSAAADDSQSSLHWIPSIRALSSQEVNLKRRVRMAVAYDTFELILINENEEILGVFPLSGQTLTTAMSFVSTQAREMGLKGKEIEPIGHFELPDHPLKQGAPFQMVSPSIHQELARYRRNAALVLKAVAGEYEYAADVATWPHHFDTASLLTAKFDDQSNAQKTIGMGMAIPDELCDEHYFYVNHWVKDGTAISYDTLPSLPSGAEWKTESWRGAILPMSVVAAVGEAAKQCELADSFLRQAIKASLDLLEETPVKA